MSETLFSTKTCCGNYEDSNTLLGDVRVSFHVSQSVKMFVVINFIERFSKVHDKDIGLLIMFGSIIVWRYICTYR